MTVKAAIPDTLKRALHAAVRDAAIEAMRRAPQHVQGRITRNELSGHIELFRERIGRHEVNRETGAAAYNRRAHCADIRTRDWLEWFALELESAELGQPPPRRPQRPVNPKDRSPYRELTDQSEDTRARKLRNEARDKARRMVEGR